LHLLFSQKFVMSLSDTTVQGFQTAIHLFNRNVYFLCVQQGIKFKDGHRDARFHFPNLLWLIERMLGDKVQQVLVQSDRMLGQALSRSSLDEDALSKTTVPLVNSPEINSNDSEIDEFVVIPLFKQLPAHFDDE